MDEIVVGYDSVFDACSRALIKAYSLESENFETCHICDDDDRDIQLPPISVVTITPVCPSGTHPHGIQCHADHVCEQDQIGGGADECETCPDGEAPNWNRTVCKKCRHGESDPPGLCLPDPACGRDMTDLFARGVLSGIPRQPWEDGAMFVCKNKRISAHEWNTYQGSDEVCSVRITIPPDYRTC